ncbi:MAG TPA: Gfo/Idh/MocA family oxidoreductase [Opitutaceae bacterium]|nr:Gfo/Idh/MocA family oxidoreductase [Opitutaceae bacterium]
MNKVRVALVGSGYWGRHHARVFHEHPQAELCALVGATDRGKPLAERLGARHYRDLQAMLGAEKPDLVTVCLPFQRQAEMTLRVLRAGYAVLTEKPLAATSAEARELLREAETRRLFFGINFNHRYAHPFQLARQAIDRGDLGETVCGVWRFGGAWDPQHPHGTLIESLCHGFDMLEHLIGPVSSVMCEMTDKTGAGFRSAALSLAFANGAVASVLGTYDSSFEYPYSHYFELNGTEGRVFIRDTQKHFLLTRKGSEISKTWEAGLFNDAARQFTRMMDAHLDAVIAAFIAGAPPPIPAQCGLRALLVAEAAIASHAEGQRMPVGL